VEQLHEVLTAHHYPGRGVVWARTLDGALCGGYFLTGRSAASRAREIQLRGAPGGAELVVAPTGTAAGGGRDPLRHYVAARERDGRLVFGNGEQVAVVSDRLAAGAAPGEALDALDYEPDPPIFTPRITVVAETGPAPRAWFGAARRSAGGREATDLLTLAVRALAPGDAVLMTTYRSDGRTVATGAPYLEARTDAAEPAVLLDEIWGALARELRVGVAVFRPGRLAEAIVRSPRGGRQAALTGKGGMRSNRTSTRA